jgi:predicted amidohydrolase
LNWSTSLKQRIEKQKKLAEMMAVKTPREDGFFCPPSGMSTKGPGCSGHRIRSIRAMSGSIQFWGGSFLACLSGQVIKKASMMEEENLLCTVDLVSIEQIRYISSYPFRDRRVDSYQDLTKLYSS